MKRFIETGFLSLALCAFTAQADPSWYSTQKLRADSGFSTAPANVQEDVGQQISLFERQRPWFTTLCLALPKLDTKRYQVAIPDSSFADDDRIAYDHLVRVGLMEPPIKQKDVLVYKMSKVGKAQLSDDRCTVDSENSTAAGALSIPYAKFRFTRFLATNIFNGRNPNGGTGGNVAFARNLFDVSDWSKDKDLRRAFRLPGLNDLESIPWCSEYVWTSNGAELRSINRCMIQ